MGSDWKTFTLEELASEQKSALATGLFGSAISSKFFQENGIPVIRGGNLSANTSDRMSDDGLVFVSEEKAAEFKRSVVRKGDLIFTCWGTINQVGLLDEQRQFDEYIISNKQMKVTLDVDKADPLFVYYMFSGPKKQKEILQNGIGAAVPGFNLGQLREHKLTLPNINNQRRIASYLDSLDQKITLNNQINQTLEQMAQTLFKSWFVDFDPVKAKMNAEQPEWMDAPFLSKEVASLFPEKLVESELGLIPEGWKVGTLNDIAEFQNGYAFKGKDWTDEGFPVVKIGSVKPGIVDLKSCSYVAKPTIEPLERFKLSVGDILVGMTGYVGETGLVPHSTVAPYLNQRVGRLTPLNQNLYELLYVTVRNAAYKQFAEAQAQGSAQANVSGKALMSYPIVIPSEDTVVKFSELIAPMIKQKLAFSAQSEMLAQTRDTLLPKLLSGEIDLESVQVEAEKAITE
ncbi:restriction endonuclease subunit S [Vibrio sp. 10N.239.311.G01]|uniref:restriction endonuclease subunit S n=1 Tax=Vibrio sp. 10N.239.311.G01 TaxID=3229976 RepID=UPI00354E702C